MAQEQKGYLDFTKGLMTEANPLNFPMGFTEDELNCVVTDKGGRAVRFGFNNIQDVTVHNYSAATLTKVNKYVDGTTIPTGTHKDLFNSFVWDSPGGDAALKFLVVQEDNLIKFFDISVFNKVTAINTFAINVQKYLINSRVNVGETVEFFQGKNALFICSREMESIYVEYDLQSEDITETIVDIKIRDFDQFVVDFELNDEPQNPGPEYIYNLKNQGWVPAIVEGEDPIQQYIDAFNRYPSLSMQWWVSKRFDTDPPDVQRFNPQGLRAEFFGNAQAPKGHYIYSAFNINRAERAGLGLENIRKSFRSQSGTFAFGRAFWTDGELIYFSQTIESNLSVSGNCFQAGDPTAEYSNELVDTDGGVVSIIDANNIRKLVTVQNGVIAFAANGVWAIQGGDGDVFKPNNFRVYQITTDGLVNTNSLTIINDSPIWASEHSVNALQLNPSDLRFQASSLTEETIKTFYISQVVNKESIRMYYDRLDDKVYLMYNNSNDFVDNFFTKALILDTRFSSWHPWDFAVDTEEEIFQVIRGAFVTDQTGIITNLDNIVVGADRVVVNGIQLKSRGSRSTTNITTSITFITENNADEFRFGRFEDSDYTDFDLYSYEANFTTGPMTAMVLGAEKNVHYLYAWFREALSNDECSIYVCPDFINDVLDARVQGPYKIYKSAGPKRDVNRTKIQLPGSADYMNFRFENVPGKGFELYGLVGNWDTSRRN